MIRRIVDFTLILLFMWACMILGLWIIDRIIVPLEIPYVHPLITAIIKVGASSVLAIIWLWIWREIVKRMFWHTLKSYRRRSEQTGDGESGGKSIKGNN
ncbi:hypothetical protein DRO37_03535 [Candidatus Bathyarchaeota archaeon]|nr:MAG: hypothetical protein DRO37_03535 [Candidatus Bathyarchaeota archaeon]